MKNFGKKIVLVLVSFLILAVPFLMTACEFSLEINNKDNSGEITQEENVDLKTMSLDDARALMTKVCMACTGVKDANKLSPASVENYNYDEVQVRDLDSPIVMFLLQIKYALDYSDGENDYLKTKVQWGPSPEMYTYYYFTCKLQEKSVIFDVVLYYTEGFGNGRFSLKIYDLGNDDWYFEFYFYPEIKNKNFSESESESDDIQIMKCFCSGEDLNVKKYEFTEVYINANAYFNNDLISKDDFNYFKYFCIDTIEHKVINTYVRSGDEINFPDEAVDFVNDCRSFVKDAWKPEFDEAKFKDCPAIQEKAYEFYNQLGD